MRGVAQENSNQCAHLSWLSVSVRPSISVVTICISLAYPYLSCLSISVVAICISLAYPYLSCLSISVVAICISLAYPYLSCLSISVVTICISLVYPYLSCLSISVVTICICRVCPYLSCLSISVLSARLPHLQCSSRICCTRGHYCVLYVCISMSMPSQGRSHAKQHRQTALCALQACIALYFCALHAYVSLYSCILHACFEKQKVIGSIISQTCATRYYETIQRVDSRQTDRQTDRLNRCRCWSITWWHFSREFGWRKCFDSQVAGFGGTSPVCQRREAFTIFFACLHNVSSKHLLSSLLACIMWVQSIHYLLCLPAQCEFKAFTIFFACMHNVSSCAKVYSYMHVCILCLFKCVVNVQSSWYIVVHKCTQTHSLCFHTFQGTCHQPWYISRHVSSAFIHFKARVISLDTFQGTCHQP
jgi:hypothetical protein